MALVTIVEVGAAQKERLRSAKGRSATTQFGEGEEGAAGAGNER